MHLAPIMCSESEWSNEKIPPLLYKIKKKC